MAISATARERRMSPLFEEPDPLDKPVRATVEMPRRLWNKVDAIAAKETLRQGDRVSRWGVIARMVEIQVAAYEFENGKLPDNGAASTRKRGKK